MIVPYTAFLTASHMRVQISPRCALCYLEVTSQESGRSTNAAMSHPYARPLAMFEVSTCLMRVVG